MPTPNINSGDDRLGIEIGLHPDSTLFTIEHSTLHVFFFYNAVPALWDFTCYVLHLIRAFKGFSSVLLGVFLKQTIIIIIPISTYLNGNQNPTFTLT